MVSINEKKSDNDKLINNFVNFMKKHSIKKDDTKTIITHTLMGPLHQTLAPWRGKYNIKDDEYDTYIKLYNSVSRIMDLHIVERPKDVGPIVIDIDFKTSIKYRERQYLDEHIEFIIETYIKLFKEYIDIKDEDITAFVFEKPSPTFEQDKSLYKDGFHVLFPSMPLHYKKRYFFFNKAKEIIMKEDAFANIPFVNSYDEILDASVVMNNGLLMYGSHKENRDPYFLTKIYNHDMTIETIDDYDDDYLVSFLSIRKYNTDQEKKFKKIHTNNTDFFENIFDKYSEKNKPVDKSDEYTDSDEQKEDQKEDQKVELPKVHVAGNQAIHNDPNNINLAEKLAKILSKKRSKDYNDWIRVGWALKNISPTLLPAYIDFSKKCSEKFKDGECEKVWKVANKSGYSFASLYWWAKQDSPEGFAEIMRDKIKPFILDAESGTHHDIALVVKELYGHLYKCVNITKNVWYEFQGHKWICIDSAYTLSEKISSELTKEFMLLNQYYLAQCIADPDTSKAYSKAQEKNKKFNKLYEKLKTDGFVKSVISVCSRLFYDKAFEEKLNTNTSLVGFENGVYDLESLSFRKGTPDDLISMTVGYNYIEYEEKSQEIKDIEKFFSQVQKEDDLREYLLRLISSFLDGRVRDQKFIIWTGSGCHAKDEKIKMFNNKDQKIQNIKIGDNVLGPDGRKRHVSVVYTGKNTMYQITAKDDKNTKFKVTKNHRLALRCHYIPKVIVEYDDVYEKDIYMVNYHKFADNNPTKFTEQFHELKSAQEFINNLKNNNETIQYGEVIPIFVDQILLIDKDVIEYYKMCKYKEEIENDKSFELVRGSIQKFYGIELDGDKKYIMSNGYITYNSNGKSTTIDLIHETLGQYSGVLPVTILTKKRGGSSSALPELADKRGKRFLVIQEPEHDDTVFVGQMKELTAGNDKIYARALYGDPFIYKPQFKLVLICNKLPSIPSTDGGTWRRIRALPYESEFIDGEPTQSHQFKKDHELEEKMKKWNKPFVWLLLNKYYPKYIKYGLQEPKKVTQYTENYKKASDIYLEFLSEYTNITKNDNDSIPLETLYEFFKDWYKKAYQVSSLPAKKLFIEYLTSTVKLVIKKKNIHGITMGDGLDM